MKKGEVDREKMMNKLEERMRDELEEPIRRVAVLEAKNGIHFVNQSVTSVIRFFSGPVNFTIGWLDKVDRTIHQHLTSQGLLMKEA